MARSRTSPFRFEASPRRLGLAALGALVVLGHAEPGGAAPIFLPLGDLAGGTFRSGASDVSADGTTVVGTSMGAAGQEAFRWTIASGIVGLGDLPGGRFDSGAFAISADGSTVVGQGFGSADTIEAFRFTSTGGMESLVALGSARGVSADGSTVAGAAAGQGFVWTSSGGAVGLGTLPGGYSSFAWSLSDDGSTVVGEASSSSGSREAFYWTSAAGMQGLGDLPGGLFESHARAVSADGSVVVGAGTGSAGQQAIRWTSASGMVGLGDLPGGTFYSGARAVSADGTRVVGVANSGSDEAFLWSLKSGMRELDQLLIARGLGVALTGWTLTEATGISDDGRVIVGTGINPSGQREAWYAVIPEPGTGVLLAIGLVWLGSQRRAPLRA